MRPNPSDPERTVSVAIVATRLRSDRLGELRPEQRTRLDPHARANVVHRVVPDAEARLAYADLSGSTGRLYRSAAARFVGSHPQRSTHAR